MKSLRSTINSRCGGAILVAATLAAGPALADQADDIVKILGYEKYYDNLSSLTVNQAIEKLRSHNVSGTQLTDDQKKLEDDASSYKSAFMAEIAKSYRAKFTASELSDLLAFYRSPLGQKVGATQGTVKDDVVVASRNLGVYIGVQAAQLVK